MACLMELAFSFTSSLIKLSTSANAWPLEQSLGLEMGGGLLLGGNSDLGKSVSVMKLPIPTCTASMSTQQTGVLSPTSNK